MSYKDEKVLTKSLKRILVTSKSTNQNQYVNQANMQKRIAYTKEIYQKFKEERKQLKDRRAKLAEEQLKQAEKETKDYNAEHNICTLLKNKGFY